MLYAKKIVKFDFSFTGLCSFINKCSSTIKLYPVFFLFSLYQYGKSQKWGFEFGHSAHEAESLPLYRPSNHCVFWVKLGYLYVTHSFSNKWLTFSAKFIKLTESLLYLRSRSSGSGLPYCYHDGLKSLEKLSLMQQRSTYRCFSSSAQS